LTLVSWFPTGIVNTFCEADWLASEVLPTGGISVTHNCRPVIADFRLCAMHLFPTNYLALGGNLSRQLMMLFFGAGEAASQESLV
jgi:hypothetical protein